jgi:hypothetical protein
MLTAYAIKLADGRVVVGAVHGAGGLIGCGPQNASRVRAAIKRATEGKSLNVYEPKFGHIAMYPSATTADAGPVEYVDVRGATLVEEI